MAIATHLGGQSVGNRLVVAGSHAALVGAVLVLWFSHTLPTGLAIVLFVALVGGWGLGMRLIGRRVPVVTAPASTLRVVTRIGQGMLFVLALVFLVAWQALTVMDFAPALVGGTLIALAAAYAQLPKVVEACRP